ncbi:hypothetical protein PLESTB_000457300 [Pleodorina starrii]|uniref:PPM-type phosphatase domain-containing protein n=1 Tax=Pleodorina starrii TaxID=330485 RepID=A0A9W6BFV1_9CHLO|nr:hypothetical protein PLESTM_000758800 [Pleodorina starrii]GLC51020.1 hypothetical protein PLESTB_000457300 [Pleodorina starrii]
MVISEVSAGGGAWTASTSVRQALLPFKDAPLDCQDWARSRAQQQLLWDTLQSVKEKAAKAFAPLDARQPLDPFREVYSDGGLFGAGCNYAVGFHGIQGRQPKCEDYVLHLALGPDLFAPFDDCSRACLACVLDGHGGTGAVQYVAERFPSYLLADLPRLRSQPGAAMRSALHRIDEELTALGHNSGTTVNALLLVDNHVTVVNTGDCRCILYDWVDERAVQVTHDHNLQSSRERERVLGEGAELSGCGGYVVLPCPTDGAKLLGVTKALGHAGVKALQRSCTMGSLSGILEAAPSLSPRREQQLHAPSGPAVAAAASSSSSLSSSICNLSGLSGPTWPTRSASARRSFDQGPLGVRAAPGTAVASVLGDLSQQPVVVLSGSGMSDDDPVMPAPVEARDTAVADVDMCAPSCSALTGHCLQHHLPVAGCDGLAASACDDTVVAAPDDVAPAASDSAPARAVAQQPAVPGPQRCSGSSHGHHSHHQGSHRSSFATAAGVAVAAAVAAAGPEASVAMDPARSGSAGLGPLATLSATGTGGSFMLTCEPDEFEFTVQDDRHMVLLGCDGVFDRMGNTEACKTALRHLTSSNSCVDAAREVTQRACRLGSLDNITALVLRFGRKPIVRRQSFSVLSLRRSSSNTSGDLAASGGSAASRA